jgi:FixJ family two-component response regulator
VVGGDGVVYVVDDDAGVRIALMRLLRSVGLHAVAFSSAQAFLASVRPQQPSCLVLDLRLPDMGGLELQTRLVQAQEARPIIFLTGHGSVPASVRAMKGGAVDFFEKPVDEDELLRAIQRALALSRHTLAEQAERADIQRRLDMLTARERQVFELVIAGMLNKQIAAELGAAEKTIKVHRARVMHKMRADSVADLVRMGAKVGLQARASPAA